VSGFKEIYKQQVMHRDLKLANILLHFPNEDFDTRQFKSQTAKIDYMNDRMKTIDLVQSQMQVKIADLGFSRELQFEDMTETVCGTPLIMAPEVLNGVRYNHKADVWSLGIIFFELITGFTPFTGRDREDLKRNLEKG
jgi:serine/threonine-protein kinase ULK/ATG1